MNAKVRRHLRVITHHAALAEMEVGLWADNIRQQAETRLGIDSDDERAWADPAYAAALDLVGQVSGLRAQAARVERLIASDT